MNREKPIKTYLKSREGEGMKLNNNKLKLKV